MIFFVQISIELYSFHISEYNETSSCLKFVQKQNDSKSSPKIKYKKIIASEDHFKLL